MKSLWISNAKIYLPDRCLEGGSLLIEGGRISGVLEAGETPSVTADAHYDAAGCIAVPGFIDLHVHGGGGAESMDAAHDPDAVRTIARFHAAHGTTGLLVTTLTAPHADLLAAVCGIVRVMDEDAQEGARDGAEVLGIHLEGPYLNPRRCGAQDPAAMRLPDRGELTDLLDAAQGAVKLITLAPEQGDALELVPFLRERGVTVSIGHSDANADTVAAAARAGATHVTHLFNGMSPIHHREPGAAGAALLHDELAVELICDGLHLHPDIVRMAFRLKPPERIVLITDAIAAAGCPDGDYLLGGLPIAVRGGKAVLRDGGNLAGSCLTMDRALANAMAYTGKPLADILPALTINPARQIGADDRKGSIEPGKDADLVILDPEDLSVMRTYVKGRLVFERKESQEPKRK